MNNQLYRNGMPDINAVRTQFPENGEGRISHTTSCGDAYEFTIKRTAVGYQSVIECQPDYKGHDDGYHSTHRLPLADGKRQICFRKAPQDLPTVVWMSLLWCEGTSWYRVHGGTWR